MRRMVLVPALALAVLGLAAPAGAQAPGGLEITGVSTAQHPRVTVEVAVPGALFGQQLPAEAFEVVEGPVRRPVEVRPRPADDLAVVLAIDTSGSMAGAPIRSALAAARTFLDGLPAEVPVALVGFGERPVVAAELTTNRAQLRGALDRLAAAGETALHDAMVVAARVVPADPDTRSTLVLLSDGGDTVSANSLSSATDALLDRSVAVEAVALETAESDVAALQLLADTTGGGLARTPDPQALAGLYAGIANQLVNRYELTWTAHAGGSTPLTVNVDHAGVQASAQRTILLPGSGGAGAMATPPTGTAVVAASWTSAPWVLPVGALAVFVGLVIVLLVLVRGGGPRTRLAARPRWIDRVPMLGAATESALQAAERHLDHGERRRSLDVQLERAGMAMRAAEYLVFVACGAVLVLLVGLAVAGPVMAVLLATGVALGARAALSMKARRRQAAFTDDLPDTLQLLAGSLRAGHGLVQALDAVSQQADEPTAGEFQRVLTEIRLGRDLEQALDGLVARMDVDDLDWIVQAMKIHREVGGDLAEVLDNVAATVRERAELRGKVKALTAQGRLSAIILVILPFFMAGALAVLRPGYLNEFTTHPIGYVMLAVGGCLMTVGGLWIKRLVRLVY